MPLTKEQLLIPRYMCTGTPGKPLWWGCHWKHGDIIKLDSTIDGLACIYEDYKVKPFVKEIYFNEAPHLFRPMPWWEGRKPEDMPEYVTVNLLGSLQWMANEIKTGAVYKLDADFKYNYYKGHYLGIQYNNGGGTLGEYLLPATEQEYLDYQKQKEG